MKLQKRDLTELLVAASHARQKGDHASEKQWLDQALAHRPQDPKILNMCGMNALSTGDLETARSFFSAATSQDGKEPALWMNVATACRALHDSGGERDSLSRVLAIDPLHFMAQLRSAELMERLSLQAEAAEHWSNVVQMALSMADAPPTIIAALKRGQAFLKAHKNVLAQAVDAKLGDRLADMGPQARRFKACLDQIFGRRVIYTNHCAGLHFPFLPAEEFFDRTHFPWLADLEKHTEAIATEATALLRDGTDLIRPYVKMPAGSPDSKWSPLDGSLDWSACFLWEYGVRNDPVCALCPQTAAALAAVPQTIIAGKAPTAFFSILKPGAHIPPHTGVTNTRTIIHLPLVVPPNCRFRVGGETRDWVKGEALAFDDTIEHEAWNESSEPRLVLIFDVWNPYISAEEQSLIRDFYEIADSSS